MPVRTSWRRWICPPVARVVLDLRRFVSLNECDPRSGLELDAAAAGVAVGEDGREDGQATGHAKVRARRETVRTPTEPGVNGNIRSRDKKRFRQKFGGASGDERDQKTHAVSPDHIADLNQLDPAVLRMGQVIPTEARQKISAEELEADPHVGTASVSGTRRRQTATRVSPTNSGKKTARYSASAPHAAYMTGCPSRIHCSVSEPEREPADVNRQIHPCAPGVPAARAR